MVLLFNMGFKSPFFINISIVIATISGRGTQDIEYRIHKKGRIEKNEYL